MNEHEDIKKISYAIDEMMFRYLAVLRPMQAAAVESKVGYHLLKRPVNTILAYLNNHDGEGVCSLAKNVAVSEKSIGRYIKQMTDLGLLERSVDTEDLRVGRIFITQKGRDIMNEQEEFAFDYMEKRFCGGLSPAERRKGFSPRFSNTGKPYPRRAIRCGKTTIFLLAQYKRKTAVSEIVFGPRFCFRILFDLFFCDSLRGVSLSRGIPLPTLRCPY